MHPVDQLAGRYNEQALQARWGRGLAGGLLFY